MTFHVPEKYRNTAHQHRLGWSSGMDHDPGYAVCVVHKGSLRGVGRSLYIIATSGGGWEHVSVHAYTEGAGSATPNWAEMCAVKDLFWDGEDAVMQLHPRKSEYVNAHPFVLHLWRPAPGSHERIPEPPYTMVGPKVGQTDKEAYAEGMRMMEERGYLLPHIKKGGGK